MGTAFAEKLFGMLGSNASPAELLQTMERFVDMCRANCRPGWEDACIEPVGLVVRCLYPQLLAARQRGVGSCDPRLPETVLAWCRPLFVFRAHKLPANSGRDGADGEGRRRPRAATPTTGGKR